MYQNNYADFIKRFAAAFIDNIIVSVVAVPVGLAFYGFGYFTYVIAAWLYYAGMESSVKQATLGKMALGIIVTDLDGNRISFGKATGRYFGKLVSAMILCIGYIMAAFTERKQALHDMMAGTLVLNGAASGYSQTYNPSSYTPAPSAPMGRTPVLYGITGEFSGRSIQIDNRGLTMGRDSSFCQVSFSGNTAGISRRHCTVNFNPSTGTFVLVDVGSSYGTFLESGMKIMQGQAVNLRPGERFYVADRNNMFEVRL